MTPQAVRFPTWNPITPHDMTRPEVRERTVDGVGTLFLPEGPAERRPAVVISEGLGGLKPSREFRYGKLLAEQGHVALAVDSFGARDAARYGDVGRALRVSTGMMVADAYAGLRYLAAHPRVRPDAISIIGFSYGGMVAVLTAHEQFSRLYLGADGPRFAGHVSYYGCSLARFEDPTTTGAPVLMLVAELDRNVSLDRSRQIAEDLRRGGSEVRFELFEETYHQWDGMDLEKRHVAFSLVDCHVRIGRDHLLRSERSGRPIRGRLGRLRTLLRHTNWKGYDILRSEQAIERSDALLLGFLEEVAGGRRDGPSDREPARSGGAASAAQ